MTIHTKLLATEHDRQLPLIAARHVLDALSKPDTIDGLRSAAEHARLAASKAGELCAKVGRDDLLVRLMAHSQAARTVRDHASQVAGGQAAAEIVRAALTLAGAILRACVDSRLQVYLPNEALRATGSETAEAILIKGAMLKPGYEFSRFPNLPSRTDANPVAAFTADLRAYAAWLRLPCAGPRKGSIAWMIGTIKQGQPYSIIDLPWRGHVVEITPAELDHASFPLSVNGTPMTTIVDAADALERLALTVDARSLLS